MYIAPINRDEMMDDETEIEFHRRRAAQERAAAEAATCMARTAHIEMAEEHEAAAAARADRPDG